MVSHPKEFLQELFGTTDIDAGNASITSQHSVHSGRDVLPVLFRLQIKGVLIFNQVVFHPLWTSKKYKRSLAFPHLRCMMGEAVHKSVFHFIKMRHTREFEIFKATSAGSIQKCISVHF